MVYGSLPIFTLFLCKYAIITAVAICVKDTKKSNLIHYLSGGKRGQDKEVKESQKEG
jgi:hypothetical protein